MCSFSKTRLMAFNAVLSAMCAVLGFVAVSTNSIKITFESFPILVAAFMGGPVSALMVAGVGTFLYQLLRYGITATTLLWMFPYMAGGLALGYFVKKLGGRLTNAQFIYAAVFTELIITFLNTFAIYVDSHIYGYYSPVLITASLMLRVLLAVIKGAVFGVILPQVIKQLHLASR